MKGPIAAGLLALSSLVYAQTDTHCTTDNVCYSLNIPASTAKSGEGDIFFQISAPTKMQWAAIGQGTGMEGADIFIMYANAANDNVTVSPRLGKGEVEPKFNSDAKISLLDGTGISNDKMIANIRCSSCNNWSGGSAKFEGSAGSWIFAYKAGSPIKSDSTSATLTEHDNMGPFPFDYAKAQGGSSANPLVAASTNSSQSGSVIASPGGFFQGSRPNEFYMAHGILASLAFVIFLPIGAIIIRLLSFPGLIWLHAAMQFVGYIMFIAAFGLGIYIARNEHLIGQYHPIIGIVVFALIFFQPFLGLIHHQMYKKHQTRTFWSYGHIWLGRIIITLGIINGGLGLKLANNTKGGEIAYGVVAGVVWLAYILSAAFGEFKRTKPNASEPPKYTDSPTMTHNSLNNAHHS